MLPKLTRASFIFVARFLAQEQFAIKSRYLSSALAVPSTKFQFSKQTSLVCCKNNLISTPFTRLMSNSLSDEKVKLKQEEPGISLDSYLQEPLWKGMLNFTLWLK